MGEHSAMLVAQLLESSPQGQRQRTLETNIIHCGSAQSPRPALPPAGNASVVINDVVAFSDKRRLLSAIGVAVNSTVAFAVTAGTAPLEFAQALTDGAPVWLTSVYPDATVPTVAMEGGAMVDGLPPPPESTTPPHTPVPPPPFPSPPSPPPPLPPPPHQQVHASVQRRTL